MTSCPLIVFAFASRRASILYFTIGSGMNLANAGSASSRRDASSRRTFIAAKVLSQRKEKGLPRVRLRVRTKGWRLMAVEEGRRREGVRGHAYCLSLIAYRSFALRAKKETPARLLPREFCAGSLLLSSNL